VARGRAKWKKAFDIKPALGAGMAWLEDNVPALTSRMRYHAKQSALAPDAIIEDITRPLLFNKPPYEAQYQILMTHNVDGKNLSHQGEGIRLVTAIAENIKIHGHFMQPIDQTTQHLLALEEGRIPWGLTFPLPSLRGHESLKGFVVAVPAVNNYYHVLVDYLLPVVAAIIRTPCVFNKPITFVINRPSAAVDFIVTLLCEAGFDSTIKQISLFETIVAEHYLFAKTSAASTEHGYAFASELAQLDDLIAAQTKNISIPDRIVIKRTQTRLRNILNQDALLSHLESKKFTPVVFDWSNLLFQIACFRKASQIVSVHGAALSNLCWGTGRQVLEIFPDNARKTTYLHIASQNGWTYRSAFGSREQSNQNFSIDLNQIETALHDL
jgi:Glycosyltransferase 61